MSPSRRLLAVILSLALGLGVWAASFSYQAATFTDGEILSAAALNDLLNDNFQAAADAVAERVHKDGDTMSGPLIITAEPAGFELPPKPPELLREVTTHADPEDDMAALYAINTAQNAMAASFSNTHEDSFLPVLALNNPGIGPALAIKSSGTGPLIQAQGLFEVTATGSIQLGEQGNPSLVLDAEDGTITNAVGAGLPFAFGRVTQLGNKSHGTDNWSVAPDGVGTYRITFTDTTYSNHSFATIATPNVNLASARTSENGGDLIVATFDPDGLPTSSFFSFVTFKSP